MHYYAMDLESFVFSGARKYAGLSSMERKNIDNGTVVRHVETLLEMLRKHKTRLTFFIVAEIYEWYPELVDQISREGHEIGYHTHHHTYLVKPGALAGDIALSKEFLRKYGVRGFQAPAIILNREDYTTLAVNGITYSSSVYSSLDPYEIDGVLEIPVSTHRISKQDITVRYPARMTLGMFSREIPFGSSLLLKVLGWRRISSYITELEKRGKSANLFIHNWQLFSEPRAARLDRIRDNLRNPLTIPYSFNVLDEFVSLLKEHHFGCMGEALRQFKPSTTAQVL